VGGGVFDLFPCGWVVLDVAQLPFQEDAKPLLEEAAPYL
jgi:hypothetical protein